MSKLLDVHSRARIDGIAEIFPLSTGDAEIEGRKTVAERDTDKVFAEWVEPAPSGP